jgi:hypothetical protein
MPPAAVPAIPARTISAARTSALAAVAIDAVASANVIAPPTMTRAEP